MAVRWYWEPIGWVKFNDGVNPIRKFELYLGQNCHSVILQKRENKEYSFIFYIDGKEHIKNFVKQVKKGDLNLFSEIKINGYYQNRVKELMPLVEVGTKLHIFYKQPKKRV